MIGSVVLTQNQSVTDRRTQNL